MRATSTIFPTPSRRRKVNLTKDEVGWKIWRVTKKCRGEEPILMIFFFTLYVFFLAHALPSHQGTPLRIPYRGKNERVKKRRGRNRACQCVFEMDRCVCACRKWVGGGWGALVRIHERWVRRPGEASLRFSLNRRNMQFRFFFTVLVATAAISFLFFAAAAAAAFFHIHYVFHSH